MKKNVLKTMIIFTSIFFSVVFVWALAKHIYGEENKCNAEAILIVDDEENGKINDVVKSIVNINYQPINSVIKETIDNAYIVVDLNTDDFDKSIENILDMANKTDIKVTFINKNDIFKAKSKYLKRVERDGHTVVPSCINLNEVFYDNGINLIECKEDFIKSDDEDVALIINENDTKDEVIDEIRDGIFELKDKGYRFKAFL